MKLGISQFVMDKSIPIADLARAVEARGFESLWMPEHPHIPADRTTKFPGTDSIDMPEWYFRSHDPFVALTVAAAVTTRIKIGTAITLVIEREPIVMAKQVASLDVLSGGRFQFGVGAGWLGEEMGMLGTPFAKRWQVARERVEAMKQLWQHDVAEYHSEFVNIGRTSVMPHPLQKPYPPILIGGGTHWVRQRVVEWADGWLPFIPNPEKLAEGMRDLRERAQKAGRDPESIQVTLYGSRPDQVDAYERIGVDRCLFELHSAPADKVIPQLDNLAKVLAKRLA